VYLEDVFDYRFLLSVGDLARAAGAEVLLPFSAPDLLLPFDHPPKFVV
jgi:hypothetical protein